MKWRLGWLWILVTRVAAAQAGVFDESGRLTAVVYDGDQFAILAEPGWWEARTQRFVGISTSRKTARGTQGEWLSWRGTVGLGPQGSFEYSAQARLGAGISWQGELELGALGAVGQGLLRIWLPRSGFEGAQVRLETQAGPVATASLLAEPSAAVLLEGEGERLVFDAMPGGLSFSFDLGEATTVRLRHRGWSGYLIEVELAPPGRPQARFRLGIRAEGQADRQPARLSVQADRPRYLLHGFGGNFCFNIESPVTSYTLDNLRVAWARTEMTLTEWEPENDNRSPRKTNWRFLRRHDQPGSNLRREFLLAQRLQRAGMPYVISIWHLPKWLYADPNKPAWEHGHRVPREKWDELIESISSYLLYAKRRYGVEPDLFSFNEANIGVYVLFTPEEHRDFIKRLGNHLEKLRLKTRMLLGDATGPRGTHTYVLPAAADPEALRYVGAVAFHSWGGASPDEYRAWGDLAERLKLPLLVTELGVDAYAWRGRMYDSFAYGLREAEMYQELLMYARPQATMHWEFTSDYGLVNQVAGVDGPTHLVPGKRFWLVKHFTDLTPVRSQALETSSDHPKVLLTAFAKRDADQAVYSFHVLNVGAERMVTLEGLPEGAGQLRLICTNELLSFQELAPLLPAHGSVRFVVPSRTLCTLTNAGIN